MKTANMISKPLTGVVLRLLQKPTSLYPVDSILDIIIVIYLRFRTKSI